MLTKKKREYKKKNNVYNTLTDLAPCIFSLAICNAAMGIVSNGLGKIFGEEIRQRCLEFAKMGVVECEFKNKNKIKIEYHKLKGIDKFDKKFIKQNPKWKYEKEIYCGIDTGRHIFTRSYRSYRKERDNNICSKCGHSINDWEDD